MENNMTKLRTAAIALAGILAITATSATSASAQWRRQGGWGWGPGIAAGVATGALIGSAVAARPYGGYYYGGGYGYYDEPVYAAPYAYSYGPGYGSWGYNRNVCYEGYRRVSCTQGGGY
jgi:hypothetical protein